MKKRKMSLLEAIGAGDDEREEYIRKLGQKIEQDPRNQEQERGTPSELAMKQKTHVMSPEEHEEGEQQSRELEQRQQSGERELGGKPVNPQAEEMLSRMYGTETLGMLGDLLRTVETADIRSREVVNRVAEQLDKMQELVSAALEG